MSSPLDLKGYDFSGRGGIKEVVFDGEPVDRADPSAPRTAADFLATAAAAVTGPRAAAHGDKHVTFANIAELWSAYDRCRARVQEIGAAGGQGFHLAETALTVADKMELLKIARSLAGAHNPDDYMDRAGYAACAGELVGAALPGLADVSLSPRRRGGGGARRVAEPRAGRASGVTAVTAADLGMDGSGPAGVSASGKGEVPS